MSRYLVLESLSGRSMTFKPWSIRTFDKQMARLAMDRASAQPKLHAQHVADRFQLRDHILFNTICRADYQEADRRELRPAMMRSTLIPALWRPVVCHPPIDRLGRHRWVEGSNITGMATTPSI